MVTITNGEITTQVTQGEKYKFYKGQDFTVVSNNNNEWEDEENGNENE